MLFSAELSGRSFTADEFAQLEWPPCPVCGGKLSVQRIDITMNADDEARNGRSYIAGLYECEHHCDLRTGQRVHYGQSFRSGGPDLGDGIECTCSCGDVRILARGEVRAWQDVHQVPGERGTSR
jgi:hypothetical protein